MSYCTLEWVIMLFGLKTVGATYEMAMNFMFHEMMGDFMEVEIDDVVVNLEK